MGARSETIARLFEAKAREAVALIETMSDEEWQKVTDAEKWTVGVTGHHLAGAFAAVARMVPAVVSGQSPGNFSMAALDAMNARYAQEHARCTKAETIALLESGAAAAAAAIRALSDDQLSKGGTVFTDAPPMTAEQLIFGALIDHAAGHLGSIRKTIGR